MLSERERRFVDAYMGEAAGNATKAAELAGCKRGPGLTVTASRILSRAHVALAIANIQLSREAAEAAVLASEAEAEAQHAFATRQARQAWWAAAMEQADSWPAKLKASELLGRSCADFVERVHHSGQVSAPQAVTFVFQVQA
jgi:phage terminase small subunit